MIVKMSKVYIAAHQSDKDRLLDRLAQMGLLHLEPVDSDKVSADPETLQAIANLDRAINILAPLEPAGITPGLKPMDAAREAIEIQSAIVENRDRLVNLHKMAEKMSIWGDVRTTQFEQIREAGIEIRFFSIPQSHAGRIEAECLEPVASLRGKRMLIAVIDRSGRFAPPEWADPVGIPAQDRPAIRAEAAEIDADLKQNVRRLHQLSGLTGVLRDERRRLTAHVAYIAAKRSGLSRGELFALQGWVPSEAVHRIESRLSGDGLLAAVSSQPAARDEAPPTLIRYPLWAKPIKGLFDILGTLPGYREMDLSSFFMVALPIFAAMLIGDAGYGFLIAITGLIFYRRLARIAGRPKAQMVVIVGIAALVWGILTADYFGISPETLARAGGFVQSNGASETIDYEALWSGSGFYSRASKLIRGAAPLWRQDSKQARMIIIQFSLVIGFLHLILAHLRRLVEWIPDQRALAELGWLAALTAMMVVIWHLLFVGVNRVPAAVGWIFAGALFLTSFFGKPAKNPGKRVLFGLASSLLPLLGTFSDTMSYIRLFAVGLASYYIASAFNTLGARVAEMATWGAAVPILLFGHGLNIGLAAIAIFAHGVRLNMLEFSNNAGVEWAGYAYRPYTRGEASPWEEETS